MKKIILTSSNGRIVRVFKKGGLVPPLSHGTICAQSSSPITRLDALSIAAPAPESLAQMVFNETPGGTIDGVNHMFTLTGTPTDLMLFKNGILQRVGVDNDYTLQGNLIVFNLQNIPPIDDILVATYVTT